MAEVDKTRILIAADHSQFRDGLCALPGSIPELKIVAIADGEAPGRVLELRATRAMGPG